MTTSKIISEKYKKQKCGHWYVKSECICGKILEQRYNRAGGLCHKCRSKNNPPPIRKPKEDLTNKKFGSRLVIKQYFNKKYNQTFVDILCDCGHEYSTRKYVFKKCKFCPKCKFNSKSKLFREEYLLKNNNKKCCLCKEILNKSNFGKDKSRPDKLHRFCKACLKIYGSSKKYSLTLEEVKNKYKNKCEICNNSNVFIDHCHKSNTVRGSLCSNCNVAIGLLKEDTKNLQMAIKYLEKYKKCQSQKETKKQKRQTILCKDVCLMKV